MAYEVLFRFNKRTGEVEEFVVNSTDDDLPEAEHNRRHDQRTAEVARLVERNPLVVELPPELRETEPESVEPSDPDLIAPKEIGKDSP